MKAEQKTDAETRADAKALIARAEAKLAALDKKDEHRIKRQEEQRARTEAALALEEDDRRVFAECLDDEPEDEAERISFYMARFTEASPQGLLAQRRALGGAAASEPLPTPTEEQLELENNIIVATHKTLARRSRPGYVRNQLERFGITDKFENLERKERLAAQLRAIALRTRQHTDLAREVATLFVEATTKAGASG